MRVVRTVENMRSLASDARPAGKVVAIIVTSGSIHKAHQHLVSVALAQADLVVVCVLYWPDPVRLNIGRGVSVNQWEPYQNLDLHNDLEMLSSVANIHAGREGDVVVFLPNRSLIYPAQGIRCKISHPILDKINKEINLVNPEDQSYTYFQNVAVPVCKCINIISPHHIIMGEKDWYQTLLIKQMIEDLSINVQLNCVSTVREQNGLAFSSRNRHLTTEQQAHSGLIFQTIMVVATELKNGNTQIQTLESQARNALDVPLVQMRSDYFRVCELDTLLPVSETSLMNGDYSDMVIITITSIGSIRLPDCMIVTLTA